MEYFYNQKKDYEYHEQPTHPTGHTMAAAALVMGICAVATFWTVYMPLFLGGLGVIFAILSQGFEKKMYSHAKTGLVLSVLGFVISIAIISFSLIYFLRDPSALLDYARGMDLRIMQRYGQSSEALMGASYESILEGWLGQLGGWFGP